MNMAVTVPAVSFVVPCPPRGWARVRRRGKRYFKDSQTEAFQAAMTTAATVAMRGRAVMVGALELTVTSIFAPPKSWSAKKRAAALAGQIRPVGKPDYDNLAKQVDALNGVVWNDDCQVVDGRSLKFYGEQPAMHVVVRQISFPQSQSGPGGTDRSFSQEGRVGRS